MGKKWYSIDGYYNLYQMDDSGNVRSMKRKRRKILKPNKDGKVQLVLDGKAKLYTVDDLICMI